ncbi:MAG TPA: SET domain-containing protein-lysine N-methyltransferase [Candidatus Polarisedimenticolia bacterium]|nr:SET domain-containing protein-lysine N-methyltransferase [Candidatus Polarisedimenticolia bacterium]
MKSQRTRGGRGHRYFAVRPSAIQGLGGFAVRPIARGTRIVEYTGERISHAEADARYDDPRMSRHHTFLFTLDRSMVIDAAVGGGAARFLNHSCDPNCAPVVEGGRVFIEAARDIRPGEELTYDYAYRREGGADEEREDRYACRCGARRCRGTLLSPRRPRTG